MEILKSDRIVEINGIKLFGHENYRPTRRNIICESEKLTKYMKDNNINMTNPNNIFQISSIINLFDDVKMVKIAGYY